MAGNLDQECFSPYLRFFVADRNHSKRLRQSFGHYYQYLHRGIHIQGQQ